MRYVGIDPGKKGAYAILEKGGPGQPKLVEYGRIPYWRPGGGRTSPELPILDSLISKFEECKWVTMENIWGRSFKLCMAFTSMFQRFLNEGWWKCGKFRVVAPKTWQKAMGHPRGMDTKKWSKGAVQRMYPDLILNVNPRARTPDDGVTDAVLIAEYRRLTQ